jgi:hypothetical protein
VEDKVVSEEYNDDESWPETNRDGAKSDRRGEHDVDAGDSDSTR